MINRELIRIKIVQLTYAYYQNGNKNMDNAEKELLFSLSKAYDLYNYLLELIVAVTQEEQRRVDINTKRALREGTEAPSTKFAYNKFAMQLEENKMLNTFIENQKQTWENDIEFIRKVCNMIESSQIYADYMADTDDSYEADREVWRKLYKTFIQENTDLDAILEEKSLYWNDDKEVVDTFVLKTIKRFDPKNKSKQELLPEYKDEEDKDFARKLFRATILLTSRIHGRGDNADSHCRDAHLPQHPSQRDHQRVRGACKSLLYTTQRRLHQRHARCHSTLPHRHRQDVQVNGRAALQEDKDR